MLVDCERCGRITGNATGFCDRCARTIRCGACDVPLTKQEIEDGQEACEYCAWLKEIEAQQVEDWVDAAQAAQG